MNGQSPYPYQVIRCDETDAAFLKRADLPADPQQFSTALAETVSNIRDTTDTPHSIVLVSLSEEEGVDLDYEVVYPALTTEGAAEACLSVLEQTDMPLQPLLLSVPGRQPRNQGQHPLPQTG